MPDNRVLGAEAKEAISQAMREFSFEAFLIANNAAKRNLTGKVLKVRSGRLRRSLDAIGMPLYGGGFQIGTNVFYGILWEQGWDRKDYILKPKNAKALMFPSGSGGSFRMPQKGGSIAEGYSKRQIGRIQKGAAAGHILFRRSIHFKARRFEPRSFLRKAILDNHSKIMKLLERKTDMAIRQIFPPQL